MRNLKSFTGTYEEITIKAVNCIIHIEGVGNKIEIEGGYNLIDINSKSSTILKSEKTVNVVEVP